MVAMVSLATVLLLVTGWGSAVAAQVSQVFVTNTASNPVPVAQQGVVTAHVDNSTLTTVPTLPTATYDDVAVGAFAGGSQEASFVAVRASLVTIQGMRSSGHVSLRLGNAHTVMSFDLEPGNVIVLPFPQPIDFNIVHVNCTTDCHAAVNIVGNPAP